MQPGLLQRYDEPLRGTTLHIPVELSTASVVQSPFTWAQTELLTLFSDQPIKPLAFDSILNDVGHLGTSLKDTELQPVNITDYSRGVKRINAAVRASSGETYPLLNGAWHLFKERLVLRRLMHSITITSEARGFEMKTWYEIAHQAGIAQATILKLFYGKNAHFDWILSQNSPMLTSLERSTFASLCSQFNPLRICSNPLFIRVLFLVLNGDLDVARLPSLYPLRLQVSKILEKRSAEEVT